MSRVPRAATPGPGHRAGAAERTAGSRPGQHQVASRRVSPSLGDPGSWRGISRYGRAAELPGQPRRPPLPLPARERRSERSSGRVCSAGCCARVAVCPGGTGCLNRGVYKGEESRRCLESESFRRRTGCN